MSWLAMINASIQVTLVAMAALMAASLFRSAAHRHSILLAAVLCTLASPVFYLAAAGMRILVTVPVVFLPPRESGNTVSLPSPDASTQPRDPPQNAPAAASRSLRAASGGAGVETADGSAVPAVAQFQQQSAAASPFRWRSNLIVAATWLMGTIICLAGVLRSHWKTQVILKRARPLDPTIRADVIAEAARQLGVGRFPRIDTTGKVAGPAVAGLLRPCILIPSRYLEALSRDELLQVLIHEGAHVLRRDPLAVFPQRIARALFWWHPLVYLVNRQLSRAREAICDNYVLRHVDPATYGATLLRLAALSPAMAALPVAVCMLDGRSKLEHRIRGLLDVRRRITTHVRRVTGVAVFGAFALFTLFVAATRIGAQDPVGQAAGQSPAAFKDEEAATPFPSEAFDRREFQLFLTFHGESDKPYYNMTLSAPPIDRGKNEFALVQQISQEQAVRISKQLWACGFFHEPKFVRDGPTNWGHRPRYVLDVRFGNRRYQESLGWDLGMLVRVDGLRSALDGDAAKTMDRLLARLEGERKAWESGEVRNGLKTTLSAEQGTHRFAAGRPIPIKLELTNVGDADRQYWQRPFIASGAEIVVTDGHGRRVAFRGFDTGTPERQVTIKPAETKVIESCDLSSYYYMRRPGRYTVAFRAGDLPPSNGLHFEVSPDAAAAADGDPMGRLLSLDSRPPFLEGNPNRSAKIRPGADRREMPGWQFAFVDRGTGAKEDRTFVSVWLTEESAEKVSRTENESTSASEYLGKVSGWHVYFQAPARALGAWPTAKEDIKRALDRKPGPTGDANGAASDGRKPRAESPVVEPPIGRLGHRIGSYLRIEGVRAETPKAGVRTLLVDTIDGGKLDKPVGIWIDNVELPARERCVVNGYETGRWIGTPNEVLRATRALAPQAAWQFQFYFVATSVERPRSLKIKR